jgi:hypothetical protein
MHTGSAESLREKEDRGRRIAEQIAALLNEAETLAPGSVSANGGQVNVAGASIRRGFNGWETR